MWDVGAKAKDVCRDVHSANPNNEKRQYFNGPHGVLSHDE